MHELVIPSLVIACAFLSIYRRFPRQKLRSIAVFAVLLPISVPLGGVPALIFLVALPIVLLQQRHHPVAAGISILPFLILITLQLLPPGVDWIWTFLTLVCVYHSMVAAGWANVEAPTFETRLLIAGVILSATLVGALGWGAGLCIGSLVLVLGIWRFHLHSFFDRIGRSFLPPRTLDVRMLSMRKKL
jgi:hypothetical protein